VRTNWRQLHCRESGVASCTGFCVRTPPAGWELQCGIAARGLVGMGAADQPHLPVDESAVHHRPRKLAQSQSVWSHQMNLVRPGSFRFELDGLVPQIPNRQLETSNPVEPGTPIPET